MPPYEFKAGQETSLPSNAARTTRSTAALTRSTAPPAMQSLPSKRDVGAGMANLGNTCFMNCVLEVLAHSPELCLALDCEPHHARCPIALRKTRRHRASPSPDNASGCSVPTLSRATRKSRRSNGGKLSPSADAAAAGAGSNSASEDEGSGPEINNKESTFCALCEVETVLERVHGSQADPVAPTDFVHGFMDQVAPWFKLGQQEDSHEFLRLLIEAMQKSCTSARKTTIGDPTASSGDATAEDTEYPFKLFRGTVESNVTCNACNASSSKIDPIEDIGLECFQQDSSSSRRVNASSQSSSKTLADVNSAFQRFARAEPLDAYKCESCGKVGRATKQSRLASIPPVLTLHLKRFRYGSEGGSHGTVARSGRSEVSQLTTMWPQQTELLAFGKSGSAKIEGHVQFGQVLDLRPYLTPELQERHNHMFTRLFAVIVHAGKNSHSGHYVAYVRNIQKNEWWKMDDSRVTKASWGDVQSAEAYMLFYRVVEHPIAVRLRNQANQLRAEQQLQQQQQEEKLLAVKPEAAPTPSTSNKKRKREPPEYESIEEWARERLQNALPCLPILKRTEDHIGDSVNFVSEYFSFISDEASKSGAEVGSGPRGVCSDDVEGGTDRFVPSLRGLLFSMASKLSTDGPSSFLQSLTDRKKAKSSSKGDGSKRALLVAPPAMEASDTVL